MPNSTTNRNVRRDDDRSAPLLCISQAATQLTVAPQTLRHWVKQGLVPALRMGGTIRLRREDVERIRREGLELPAARPAAE